MDSTLTFWMVAVWGALVIASWIGWGTVVERWLHRTSDGAAADWGLRAAWGMAFTLGVGGILLATHLAAATALQVLVLGGGAAWAVIAYSTKRRRAAEQTPWKWRLPVLLLLLVGYLGSVGATSSVDLNWSDDMPIYLPLVKRIVQTGDLVEPFSLRRLSSYGGQQLLQAEILAVGSESNAFLVDKGLATVLALGLVWGMLQRAEKRRRGWTMLAAGLLIVLIDVPRVNTQSQMTGVVLFLALLRTVDLGSETTAEAGSRFKYALLTGMVAAALATLRMNYVPVAAVIVILAYVLCGAIVRPDRKVLMLEGVLALAMMAVLLLPWAAALWQSSRSILYPLMLGNQRPEYSGMYTNHMSINAKLAWVATSFGYWKILLLLLPLVLIFRRKFSGSGAALYLGAILGTAAVAWVFNTISMPTLYRYTFPMLFAAAIGAALLVLGDNHSRWRTIAAAAWIILMIALNLPAAAQNYAANAKQVVAWNTQPRVFVPPRLADAYAAAQKVIPRGEPIYIAASVPSLLDFSRNTIYLGDELGVVAPDPGIPVFNGPEAVRAYFLAKGIHYLMAVDFDTALGLYSRPVWQRYRDAKDAGGTTNDAIEHNLAPVVLKMEENIDALATPDRTTHFEKLRVIKLD